MSVEMRALAEAAAHRSAGRLAQAKELLREVIARRPNSAPALHELGTLLIESGDSVAKAAELLARAVKLSPTNAQYHLDLARALRASGEPARAAAEARLAVRFRRNDPES